MKQRLADYVADFLVNHGISDCFMVTGGGAMHLNDALGHKEGLSCTYNHHEQACAIAAESYARVNNRMAALCVTTGPGGTNAITGVLGGWLDSVPMFVISGQVRFDTTARYMSQYTDGLPLRAVGDQEFDITKSVEHMCKYAVMIEEPTQIRYALEKAYHLAMTGRRGPVWIDIPVNYQGCFIETDELEGYNPEEDECATPEPIDTATVKEIIEKIRQAKRPVLYAGNGIRLSEGYEAFRKALDMLNIPVATCWDSIDAIEDASPLYVGRGGIMVDADPAELKKTTIHVEMPVHADAKDFFEKMCQVLEEEKANSSDCNDYKVFTDTFWLEKCQEWKKNYPVTQPKHWEEDGQYANVYAFIRYLSENLPEDNLTVVSNGSACVVGSHNYVIQKDARFIINSGVASMGYGLPAAVGACKAAGDKTTICIEGDGSIMMNLQELQTVLTNRLPIKLFLINNEGYHSIRQTQNNLFKDHCKVGIGPESGDLSFPDFGKLAEAFGYPYFEAHSNEEMKQAVDNALSTDGPVFCQIFVSTEQNFEPKSATKRLEDGTLVSPPLEDLAPFLDREEYLANLLVQPVEEA